MTENHQLFVFSLVLIYSIYQGFCLPEAPRVPFKSGGDASLAFISGESGPQNPKPGPRDFVNPRQPNTPQRPPGTTQTQSLSYPNPNPTSGKVSNVPQSQGPVQSGGRRVQNVPVSGQVSQQHQSGTQSLPGSPNSGGRDFVNPNYKPGQQVNSAGQSTTRQPGTTPQSLPASSQGSPNSGGRDFVNSNYKPGQPVQSGGQSTTRQPSTTPKSAPISVPSGGRDFVNPNFKPNPAPTTKPVSLQSILGPKDPFPPLNPTPSSPGPKPRDPFPALKPKNPFPSLPGSAPNPVLQNPVVSYANKASGGVTTSKPSIAGRIGSGDSSGSTPKPQEGETGKAFPEGPQDNELREFSEQLLKKDVNNAFKFVKLNVQGKTTSGSKDDQAPQDLLDINQDVFKLPTIQKLMPFYNNYILEVSENEYVTPQERNEEEDFLETVVSTPVMQHTRNFLIQNNKIGKDPKEFKDLLRTTWFSMYSRGHGKVGSSGFEHVFLAELKKDKNEVSGLHNWLYFHEAEKKKLVNYLGYMKKIDLGEKGAILKFHFTLNDVDKPVSSIFVGTSPELEMALYTTCYVFRPNRVCPLRLSGHNFIVRAYSLKYRGKQLLGSAFPEI